MRVKSKTAVRRHGLPIIPAIVIAGGSFNPAAALELGDIQIQSHLGQPLRASIAYALAPNEAIADYCVSLSPSQGADGMPSLNNTRISVANGIISLNGSAPVREPLLSARLSVKCPYTPNIAREYMLFVDPAPLPQQSTAVSTRPASTARALPAAAPVSSATSSRQQSRPDSAAQATPVSGSRYRVQPGDSLSDIASRLQDRQVGLWQAVNAIFAANPQAFMDNDPNRLKAGSVLTIPLGTALGEVGAEFAAAAGPSASEPAARSAGEPDDTVYLEPAGANGTSMLTAGNADATAETLGSDNPFVAAGSIDTVIDPALVQAGAAAEAATRARAIPITPAPEPVVQTAEPVRTETAPIAPAARTETRPATDNGIVWWTLGGALALIAGLFLFRRRQTPLEAPVIDRRAPHPRDRFAEEDSIEVEVISAPGEQYGESPDFDLTDDSPTEENPALDADLVAGDGLSKDPAATEGDLDIAIDIAGAQAEDDDTAETDIIPPLSNNTASILESEVLPEEDEYDMSVIVDATKMPRPEDATQRDLMAVVIEDGDDELTDDSYTLNKEVDYQILEQDYEDELTATQALNLEIERAARELSESADDAVTVESETLSGDETTALPLASVTELDLTASMPAGNDDDSAPAADATGLTEELTARLPLGDATEELPAADAETAEITAKLQVKAGKRGA